MKPATPRAVALRILCARYETEGTDASTTYSLAEFQQEAVSRARAIMRSRRGVIVADSVGLGKTFIAAALLEAQLEAGGTAVVVVPAAMRPVWRRALKPLIDRFTDQLLLLTHTQLSRGNGGITGGDTGIIPLVIVDEAHAFRNPQTRRYHALRRLRRLAQVALLTATPVNNCLADLYFQLRLFARDDAFRDLGIGSLATLLHAGTHDDAAFGRLRDAVMIRRTRASLRRRYGTIQLPRGEQLRFPRETRLYNVAYTPLLPIAQIEDFLTRMTFAAYARDVQPTLLRLSLLKRMQSSRHALLMSLNRLQLFHEQYLEALHAGRILRPRNTRSGDVAEQLVFTELLLEHAESAFDTAAASEQVRADADVVREFIDQLDRTRDAKLESLVQLLEQRGRAARTLVFTEFRDTAHDLWRRLQRRCPTALITGSEAYLGSNRASRAEIIRRFAPKANGAAAPARHEKVSVLIATDVLAEGLNLQDADAVVSYDLPWNPVRLIQRAGRVDRMGSEHDVVKVYNFMPDREFDQFLGLVRRLRAKLLDMRAAVGQEGAVLDPDEVARHFYEEHSGGGLQPLRAVWQEHRHEAAPPGAAAALTDRPQQVLVVWSNSRAVRELLVSAAAVRADPAAVDRILQSSLQCDVLRRVDLRAAIARSRDYLITDAAAGAQGGRAVELLAKEIRRAVQRMGLLAAPELLAEADRALNRLAGYMGSYRAHGAQLRAAATPSALAIVLREISDSCTPAACTQNEEWQLVGAIGAD